MFHAPQHLAVLGIARELAETMHVRREQVIEMIGRLAAMGADDVRALLVLDVEPAPKEPAS